MNPSSRPQVNIFPTTSELSVAAASYVADVAAQAAAQRGSFTVAISGGSLPRLLCPPLLAEPLRGRLDWAAWHLFFADERCVPLDHPDSNYRLAREALFDHVTIPAAQIFALDPALAPVDAAAAYQASLASLFQPSPGQLPRFDLILLGMGEDGHTASLFPGHPLLTDSERWVASIVDSPKPPPARITLTLPVINNARHVAFITTGAGKAGALAQVLGPQANPNDLPAGLIRPTAGELAWFVDQAAAAGLAG